MIENLKLTNEIGPLIVNAIFYQHMVGKFIYFTNTCPNLTFAVGVAQVVTWPFPKRPI
jgi:hypothetical protein